jgi:hypothetical protein
MPAFAIAHLRTPQLNEEWPGTTVVIESPAYQGILPLRTRHIDGDTIIVEGVQADYDAVSTAARLPRRNVLSRRSHDGGSRFRS